MNSLKIFFVFVLIFFSNIVSAKQWLKTYSTDPFIGPEIYYLKREKEGGAKQDGPLYGVRIGYDRVQRYKMYWGIDALWAKGTLCGHVGEEKLKSEFTDINAESRIGFTFQCLNWRCASFTPFTGLGFFWEINNYKKPSPLLINFTNDFSYCPFGFLSQIFITPNWTIGLNAKGRYVLEGKQKVTNDPKYGKLTQQFQERLQYRIELPITYFFCWKTSSLAVRIVPFYDYREYGHRANFPFDFLETKLRFYGATLKMLYLF